MTIIDEVGKNFIKQTKYKNMGSSVQDQGAPAPEYLQAAKPASKIIDLPEPSGIDLGNFDLRKAIEERRSIRRYRPEQISLDELSYLLWLTQGVKKVSQKHGVTLRTVPSAGARHPFETYFSINRVSDLEPGLYHFLAEEHKLEITKLGSEINQQLTKATLNQKHVETSAVTFIWVAIPYRTSWRYGARAYRYIHLDAGHVCQNLYLAAESIDCGICAIGAYDDDAVNALLNIDGVEQFAIYLASLGKKAEPDEN